MGDNHTTTEPHATAQAAILQWRRIVADRDWDQLPDLLADNVTYRSPANFEPFHGKDTLVTILRAVFNHLEDFTYLRHFAGETGYALEFTAHVGDSPLFGADLLEFDQDGKITDLMVMMRPAPTVVALAAEAAKHMTAP